VLLSPTDTPTSTLGVRHACIDRVRRRFGYDQMDMDLAASISAGSLHVMHCKWCILYLSYVFHLCISSLFHPRCTWLPCGSTRSSNSLPSRDPAPETGPSIVTLARCVYPEVLFQSTYDMPAVSPNSSHHLYMLLPMPSHFLFHAQRPWRRYQVDMTIAASQCTVVPASAVISGSR
jgi:hypothetical protein